jgi:hypothetical protein
MGHLTYIYSGDIMIPGQGFIHRHLLRLEAYYGWWLRDPQSNYEDSATGEPVASSPSKIAGGSLSC